MSKKERPRFSEWLERKMKELEYKHPKESQRSIALMSDVTPQYFGRLINGYKGEYVTPSFEVAKKIILSLSKLMADTEEEHQKIFREGMIAAGRYVEEIDDAPTPNEQALKDAMRSIEQAARALRNATPLSLMSDLEDPLYRTLIEAGHKVWVKPSMPLVGAVSFGDVGDEGNDLTYDLMDKLGADYIIEADGDSYAPIVQDGDHCLIKKIHSIEEALNKPVVVYQRCGGSFCRKFKGIRLNESGEPIYDFEKRNGVPKIVTLPATDVMIQGIVIKRITDLED